MKEYRKLSTLKHWDLNPRSITKEGIERLKKQIVKLGQHTPLIIDKDGVVYSGNMRLEAFKQLGINDIWVYVIPDDKKHLAIEYAMSANDRAGKYEGDQLADLIGNFPEVEWNDYAVDIKEPQLVLDIMDQYSEVVEDEVPETPMVAESKLGEVYTLGRHRLMCGDATNQEDLDKLTGDKIIDLVLTDPPYNTGMQEKTNPTGSTWLSHMFNDSMSSEEYKDLIYNSLSNAFLKTKGEAVFYVFIDWRNVGLIKEQLQELMKVSNVIVWDKIVHGLGSDYKFTYEMCVVGKKGNPKIENRIGTDYQDIWRVQRTMGRNEDHATAKPINLLKKPILHASKEDDIVLDLFGGSGSTLIACEQTNRTCYMMELDPLYCDVIRKRYENYVDNNKNKV